MEQLITVTLKDKVPGVKRIFRNPTVTDVIGGTIQIGYKENGKEHVVTFPLTNVLAVEAEEL